MPNYRVVLEQRQFPRCPLRGHSDRQCALPLREVQDVVFRECNLSQADFQFAELRDVRFEKCDLTGAQFANVVIQPGVSFDNWTLVDVGGAAHLKGATVRGPGGWSWP
ncbi:pentapeptide repeat-containing protein [Kitasatospora sp. NPDC097691]|uniref:pentapeptide repeat-containing protein n=1 Tax=Kitasatospora sp. NPDC097691 TaxID=3157231 RepID=UPI00331E46F0